MFIVIGSRLLEINLRSSDLSLGKRYSHEPIEHVIHKLLEGIKEI